nr:hypothetical protein [Variovorax sp. PAMC 28711]
MKALEPIAPILRYEREATAGLLHIDTKKLGRIVQPSHRVTGDRRDAAHEAPAGSLFMWPWTTTRA